MVVTANHIKTQMITMFSNRLAEGDPAKRYLNNIAEEIKQQTARAVAKAEAGASPDKEATVQKLLQDQDIYLVAMSKLDPALAYCQSLSGSGGGGNGLIMRMAFIWLSEGMDGLIPLLQTTPTPQEPAVLLAFFAVLLHKSPDRWWMQGWPEHLITRIYALLDEKHRLWIRWPMEEMGWIPPS